MVNTPVANIAKTKEKTNPLDCDMAKHLLNDIYKNDTTKCMICQREPKHENWNTCKACQQKHYKQRGH